jgi:hypothetical protein
MGCCSSKKNYSPEATQAKQNKRKKHSSGGEKHFIHNFASNFFSNILDSANRVMVLI